MLMKPIEEEKPKVDYKERILDLADIIEKAKINVKFSMGDWVEDHGGLNCQTAACIAGYAVCAAHGEDRAKQAVFRPEGRLKLFPGHRGIQDEAARILGLTEEQSDQLFVMDGWDHPMEKVTKKQAAKVLRHLAETGKVDWGIVGCEPSWWDD